MEQPQGVRFHFLSVIFIALLSGLAFAGTACDPGPNAPAASGRPEAGLKGSILPTGEIAVEISIPAKHHAYLDAGREGNLIPVSFHWDLPGQSAAPAVKVAPIGDIHEEAGARVLRGNGRWVFQPAGPVESGEVKIRTQICDEIKGICFPPKKSPLSLKKA